MVKLALVVSLLSILLPTLGETQDFAQKFERKDRVIHVEKNYDYKMPWILLDGSESIALGKLISLLEKASHGKNIVALARKKARALGKSLSQVILPGEKSITDTTLVRRFSPSDPEQITYETSSKVFIGRNLSVQNGILDMAHELVHFIYRRPFNPYLEDFGLQAFIKSTVEGRGGEVDAYLAECKVALELFPGSKESARCRGAVDGGTGDLSRAKGIRQFYRLGAHYRNFRSIAGKHKLAMENFPSLSSESALFISSAYELPYPMAAVSEYRSIIEKVCANDSRRLRILAAKPGASDAYLRLHDSYKKRCLR